MTRKPTTPDTPPFPSSVAGPPAFIAEKMPALRIPSPSAEVNAQIEQAIKGVLNAFQLENVTGGKLVNGSLTIDYDSERILLGSATAPLTGVGIFVGKDGSDYEFRAGDPSGGYIHWDGSTLLVGGIITSEEIRSDTVIIGNKASPVTGDFRYKILSGTNGQVVMQTQVYDADATTPGWYDSGEEITVTETDIDVSFLGYSAGTTTVQVSHGYNQKYFRWRNGWTFDDTSSTGAAPFQPFTAGDTTPDIAGVVCWKTANTSATTITAFDNTDNDSGLKQLFILLIDDNHTTIDFSSTSIDGNNGVAHTFNAGDMLLCVRKGGSSPITNVVMPGEDSGFDPHVEEYTALSASSSYTLSSATGGNYDVSSSSSGSACTISLQSSGYTAGQWWWIYFRLGTTLTVRTFFSSTIGTISNGAAKKLIYIGGTATSASSWILV